MFHERPFISFLKILTCKTDAMTDRHFSLPCSSAKTGTDQHDQFYYCLSPVSSAPVFCFISQLEMKTRFCENKTAAE